MSKKINLDDVIKDSVLVNVDDPCPFCKGDDKFINSKESDIVKHIVDKHKPEFARIIGKIESE